MADQPAAPLPAPGPASRNRLLPLLLLLALLLALGALTFGQRTLQSLNPARTAPGAGVVVEHGQETERGVLFIGNSLTFYYKLPAVIQYLARGAGESRAFEYGQEAVGGATLSYHWEMGNARARLERGAWTQVVLQDFSSMPLDARPVMERYVRQFDEAIRRKGAETVLFMTWARRDQPESQVEITDAYRKLGAALGAKVVPAGLAWQRALERKPELLLHCDDRHPTPAGTYLTALLFYGVLFDKSPVGLSVHVPWLELNSEDAKFLQQVAGEVLKSF